MHVVASSTIGRLALLSLVGSFVVGSCTTLSVDLATVPETPPPTPLTRAVAETPTPTPTPQPTAEPAKQAVKEPVAPAVQEPVAQAERDKRTVVRLKPRPAAGPFEMNLYRKGDFVHQATKDWCVAGSTATMINIMSDRKPRSSVAFQRKLYQRGRALSPIKAKLGPIGVDLIGWAELLNSRGYGPYEVEAAGTRRGAIRKAARAIRTTGRPVGLVTWRGAHSWVMSGFTATADPAYTRDYQVKAVYIQDTWYPSVSTIWGASDPPNTLVPMGRLKKDYLPYARPRAKWSARDGRFMLILPVLPEGTVAR